MVDMYPPAVIRSPELLCYPLLQKGLLSFVTEHGVYLSGNDSMRIVKRLAVTLYPLGAVVQATINILDGMETRFM